MAIDSVLTQSFTDFELLIIDDGSTDNSLEILKGYAKKDSRIQLLTHSLNLGIAEAMKTGLRAAKGTYLHGLSASDCYLPGFLEHSLHALVSYPQMGLCCSDSGLFQDNPFEYVEFPLIKNAPRTLIFPPSKILPIFKYARFSIPGISAVIKRDSFIRYGGYLPHLHFLSDWFLNYQIALFEGAIYLPKTLTVFREPEYSKKSSQKKEIRKEAFFHLSELLCRSENRSLRKKIKKSAVLGILGKTYFFGIAKRPKLWGIYIGLAMRYFHKKYCKIMRKENVSAKFLSRRSL